MQAIEINESTQKLIAEKYNEGVIPLLRDEDPDNTSGESIYYIVHDSSPNEIVTAERYWDDYGQYQQTWNSLVRTGGGE